MAKVTFEFDDTEDSDEIDMIVHRYKMISALSDLKDYRREIYKGYINNEVVIKDNEVVYKDGEKLKEYDLDGAIGYIKEEDVLNKLDEILDKVYNLLKDF